MLSLFTYKFRERQIKQGSCETIDFLMDKSTEPLMRESIDSLIQIGLLIKSIRLLFCMKTKSNCETLMVKDYF